MNSNIKLRAKVFASLQPETIDIHVGYGYGMIDGGSLWRVNRNEVPLDCRLPNTHVWVTLSEGEIIKIEKITTNEIEQNDPE